MVIGGVTCYMTAGEYEDGTLGEIFIDIAKAGSAIRATMDAFAKNFSIALQQGTPLRTLLHAHRGTDFQPNGPVVGEGSPVANCTSIIDWVLQELEYLYGENNASPYAADAVRAAEEPVPAEVPAVRNP